jgi:hypothetical protein
MGNPKGKKNSKTTKSTNPTSTKAGPQPKPVIRVPASKSKNKDLPPAKVMNEDLPLAEVLNEDLPPAEVLNEDPLPTILHPPVSPQGASPPGTHTTSKVPNPAPAQRQAAPSSSSKRAPNAVHRKKSATTPASAASAEGEATLAAKYAAALGMYSPFGKVIPRALTFR